MTEARPEQQRPDRRLLDQAAEACVHRKDNRPCNEL